MVKIAFEIYKDAAEEWRWRLREHNGKIIADSSEGYKNKKDCLQEFNKIKESFNEKKVGYYV